jgi:hypothetical protein
MNVSRNRSGIGAEEVKWQESELKTFFQFSVSV